MKLVRMLTGKKENTKNEDKLAKSKMKSLIVNDTEKLNKLQEEIDNMVKDNQAILITDNINKENKFYKKKDVLDMIRITKIHFEQLNNDSENSVNKFKSCLEDYKEVLQEREKLVNQLNKPHKKSENEIFMLRSEVNKDTENIVNAIKNEKEINFKLFDNYEKQYEDGLIKNLSKENKMNLILKIENKILELFLKEIEGMQKKTLTCRNCKEYFNNDSNYMSACMKHTGQLKYEPCLKCKKSELFTCCGLCENCSFGCVPFEHVSIV